MRKRMLTLLFSAALLPSCNDAGFLSDEVQGTLKLRARVETAGTRAAVDDGDLLTTARINIYNGDFTGLVRTYTYAEMPEEVYLPAASYRVDVIAGEAVRENPRYASWGQKSYKGSAPFTIAANESSSVQVTASLANAVTEINFDDSISDTFLEGYTFTIGLDPEDASRCLVYTEEMSGEKGYFIPVGFEPSLFWTFSGRFAEGGGSFVRSGEIKCVECGKMYRMTPKYTSHDGALSLSLSVDYSTEVVNDVIVFEGVSTGLVASKPYEIWAAHATVHACVDEQQFEDPSKVSFTYSADGSSWTTVKASRTSGGNYDAVLTGLEPETEYTYRLVIDSKEIGESMSFITESAPQLPNYDFETVSNCESSKYASFYDPSSSDSSLKTKFWDSGSSASATVGSSYAICYTDTDVPSGIGSRRSVRMQSIYAVIKFAAGNIFVGEFAGLVGTQGGKVNFGRPWSSRPTAIRFWYKYKGGKVDYAQSDAPIKKGDYDRLAIKVALGNWDYRTYGGSRNCPVQVNTTDKSTFWDYPSMKETIAYAEFWEAADKTSGQWRQVTVPFDYYNLTDTPAYIVVSCTSSGYGDYFSGCSSSALYLDNFELVYE